MKLKLIVLGLVCMIIGTACSRNDSDRNLKLWYLAPADASIPDDPNGWKNDPEWLKALPIGNGSLGAMVYGDVNKERIQLNEKSLWSGSPTDNDNPLSFEYLDSIRNLLWAGKYREAHKLAEKTQVCQGAGSGHGNGANVPFGCFQTLGDLHLDFGSSSTWTGYYRDLDLMTGVATVRYEQNGIQYTREVFASYPDEVIVIRIGADKKGSIGFTATMDRPERFSTSVEDGMLVMTGTMKNGQGGDGMHYMARLKALNEGGTLSLAGDKLIVKDADAVTLLLAAGTDYRLHYPDYTGGEFRKATAGRISEAAKHPYGELLARHRKDFSSLMQRVHLQLSASEAPDTVPTDIRLRNFKKTKKDARLTETYFQYGRYLLVSSSRAGSLPANLQGIWANKIQTPWNCDYHTDINVQMNYWPVEVTNLSELQEPLTELIESMVKPGARTAQIHYHTDGWCVHPITNVFGFTAPGEWPSWGLHLGAGGWLVQHLWEHYAFTGDKDYLRRVWPVMKESGEFYLGWLVPDPVSGQLVSGPASSPENSFVAPDGSIGYLTMGPSHDQEVIWDLFTDILESADSLGIEDDFTRRVAEALGNLLMPKIGSDGRLMEWPEEFKEPEPGHRHMSHLFALHPGRQITSKTPKMEAAARKSLEFRLAHGGGHTGWSAAWLVNLWARLGDGENADKAIQKLLTDCTSQNMFDLHPPFQIDGNFGATAGIAEMLLQSHTGEIVLLPALPSDWPDGKVDGLVARGGFIIGMEWKDGLLIKATVESKNGGRCTVAYRDFQKDLDLKKGEKKSLIPPVEPSYPVTAGKMSARVTRSGIQSITTKDGNKTFHLRSVSRLENCIPVGAGDLKKLTDGSVELIRTLVNTNTNDTCKVIERFRPDGETIRWEIDILGAGQPWTTKIESGIRWPVTAASKFWSPWSDPRIGRKETPPAGIPVQQQITVPASAFNWGDPLLPHAFVKDTLWYGAPYFRYEEPHVIYIPYQRDLFCIPLVTAIQQDTDTGLSLVLDPNDEILDLTLTTSDDGSLIFNRIYNRISADHPLHFGMNLVLHEADWRGGLRWMRDNYPDFFDPVVAKADDMAGTSAYSSYGTTFDAAKMKKMAFRTNWMASFDFPYMGMFLPPVGENEKWIRFGGDTTSIAGMRQYAKTMADMGFYVLNYFNVTEFGTKMERPVPPRRTSLDDQDLWKDPNDFFYYKLPESWLPVPDRVLKDSVYFHRQTLPGGTHLTWEAGIVTDPGEPVYREFLLDQARRHVRFIPEAAGIAIDRMDWLRMYNENRDDGITWFIDRPARSLITSWKILMKDLAPIMHDAGKAIFLNNHVKRLDLLKNTDGIFDEFTNAGSPLNTTAFLCLNKTALGWTNDSSDLHKEGPDAFFQKYLYLGVYPMAPFPGNDHSIWPDDWTDRQYLDYGPLMDAMRGKKWVLEAHCLEVEGGAAKANLFQVPGGYVVPVVFGESGSTVTIRIRNVPRLSGVRCEALYPGVEASSLLRTQMDEGVLVMEVPLVRGCAMVRIRTT